MLGDLLGDVPAEYTSEKVMPVRSQAAIPPFSGGRGLPWPRTVDARHGVNGAGQKAYRPTPCRDRPSRQVVRAREDPGTWGAGFPAAAGDPAHGRGSRRRRSGTRTLPTRCAWTGVPRSRPRLRTSTTWDLAGAATARTSRPMIGAIGGVPPAHDLGPPLGLPAAIAKMFVAAWSLSGPLHASANRQRA